MRHTPATAIRPEAFWPPPSCWLFHGALACMAQRASRQLDEPCEHSSASEIEYAGYHDLAFLARPLSRTLPVDLRALPCGAKVLRRCHSVDTCNGPSTKSPLTNRLQMDKFRLVALFLVESKRSAANCLGDNACKRHRWAQRDSCIQCKLTPLDLQMFDDPLDRRRWIAEHPAFHPTKSTHIADIWGSCGCAPQLCSAFASANEVELGTRKPQSYLSPATVLEISSALLAKLRQFQHNSKNLVPRPYKTGSAQCNSFVSH